MFGLGRPFDRGKLLVSAVFDRPSSAVKDNLTNPGIATLSAFLRS